MIESHYIEKTSSKLTWLTSKKPLKLWKETIQLKKSILSRFQTETNKQKWNIAVAVFATWRVLFPLNQW